MCSCCWKTTKTATEVAAVSTVAVGAGVAIAHVGAAGLAVTAAHGAAGLAVSAAHSTVAASAHSALASVAHTATTSIGHHVVKKVGETAVVEGTRAIAGDEAADVVGKGIKAVSFGDSLLGDLPDIQNLSSTLQEKLAGGATDSAAGRAQSGILSNLQSAVGKATAKAEATIENSLTPDGIEDKIAGRISSKVDKRFDTMLDGPANPADGQGGSRLLPAQLKMPSLFGAK